MTEAEIALIVQEARYGTDCPVSGDFDASVKDAIQAGYRAGKREAMRWIPVGDRLPENNDPVLAIESSGAPVEPRCIATYVAKTSRNGFAPSGWVDYAGDWIDVSHWMPLPTPPEGHD